MQLFGIGAAKLQALSWLLADRVSFAEVQGWEFSAVLLCVKTCICYLNHARVLFVETYHQWASGFQTSNTPQVCSGGPDPPRPFALAWPC